MYLTLLLLAICVLAYIFAVRNKSYYSSFVMYMFSVCAVLLSSFMYMSKSTVFQFVFQVDYYIYSYLYNLKLPISTLSSMYNVSVSLFMLSSLLMTKKIRPMSKFTSAVALLSIIAFAVINDFSVSRHIFIMMNGASRQISKTFWREMSLAINLYTEVLFLIFTLNPIIILIVRIAKSKIYLNRHYSGMLLALLTIVHGFIFISLKSTYAGVWFTNTDMTKIPIPISADPGFFVMPIVLVFVFLGISILVMKVRPSGPFRLISNSQWLEQNMSLLDSIGMAFHTHKNSLIALRQHLELIQIYMKKKDEEKIDEHFDISYGVINTQLETITKTLKHLRSSKAPARQVDLSECIREAVKKLSFDGYLEQNLLDGCIVLGDREDLGETFLNVLYNAEYALNTREDKQIKIKMIKEDEFIEVDVWDNGCGISKENLRHVFTPFFSTKPALQFGGLGLSSVRATITAHRGDVKIRSQENQYTVIKMVFPAYINKH